MIWELAARTTSGERAIFKRRDVFGKGPAVGEGESGV